MVVGVVAMVSEIWMGLKGSGRLVTECGVSVTKV